MITSFCNLGRESGVGVGGVRGGGANEQILRLITRIGPRRERKGKTSLRSRVQLANASRAKGNCQKPGNVFQAGENLRR